MDRGDVTAVVVTRGDRDISDVLESIPYRTKVWDNVKLPDFKLLGRHLLVLEVETPVVYFQDDDCILEEDSHRALLEAYQPGTLISNMPERHNLGHPELALLGWGSLVDRELPWRSLGEYLRWYPPDEMFLKLGCDIAVSVITPHRRVDVGHRDLSYSGAPERCHRQPDYPAMKQRLYDRCVELLDHNGQL